MTIVELKRMIRRRACVHLHKDVRLISVNASPMQAQVVYGTLGCGVARAFFAVDVRETLMNGRKQIEEMIQVRAKIAQDMVLGAGK